MTRRPDKIREVFRNYLRDRGVKWTSARRRVLDAALQMREHFEAEQVLYWLKEHGGKEGKATVYRTLPLLVDCGILKQVHFDVKQAYYEVAFGEEPHDHMVCCRCGRIEEFGSAEVVDLRNKIAQRRHFHAINHRLQISGLCWECSVACPVALSVSADSRSAESSP
jgi:Fur family ferric uptake transcriptional regulator